MLNNVFTDNRPTLNSIRPTYSFVFEFKFMINMLLY